MSNAGKFLDMNGARSNLWKRRQEGRKYIEKLGCAHSINFGASQNSILKMYSIIGGNREVRTADIAK